MAKQDISQVEEITSLDGTEKVFINSGGSLKQIKTENAKFGGGTKTIFYTTDDTSTVASSGSVSRSVLYKSTDSGYALVTPQDICDAWLSGEVWICNNDASSDNCYVYGVVSGILGADNNGPVSDLANVTMCTICVKDLGDLMFTIKTST